MHYISTRGQAPHLSFSEVVLTGLATDGGLYVPAYWPEISPDTLRQWQKLSYVDLALAVMEPFVTPDLDRAQLTKLVTQAYADFSHPAIAPLVQLDQKLWLMELFHGPTFAFKDYALQFLGVLFDHVLAQKNHGMSVVGATSGDTGSAAIAACAGRDNIDVFILHPDQRVSEIQRRQMTTVIAPNIHNIAIAGHFDDCQNLVKSCFADKNLRESCHIGAVNSINWARIMAQIVYYFHAALALGAPDRPVRFAVPTGNFGNVFAAYAAKRMGLPISQLIIGVNANDIIDRFFQTGAMTQSQSVATIAPAMDIQISSNFERFLHDVVEKDSEALGNLMRAFSDKKSFQVTSQQHLAAQEIFRTKSFSDSEILQIMRHFYGHHHYLADPHTAIGLGAAQYYLDQDDSPIVALGCAHPAKFGQAVQTAIGQAPILPAALEKLLSAPENYVSLNPDYNLLANYIREHTRAAS